MTQVRVGSPRLAATPQAAAAPTSLVSVGGDVKEINLIPRSLDLILYAGDGVAINLTVNDLDGNPMNVTGAVTSQIRTTTDTADPAAAEWTADLSDGANGTIKLTLTGAETAALITGGAAFSGVWDVQWKATGAEPVTVVKGKVTVEPDVTRP